MTGWIEIGLADGRTAYRPGDEVAGAVAWSLEAGPRPERAEVRLLWLTDDEADRDSGVAVSVELPSPEVLDRRDFRLRLPEGPYSFAGKVVRIGWAVEVLVEPGARAERTAIVVSPTGRPIAPHAAPR